MARHSDTHLSSRISTDLKLQEPYNSIIVTVAPPLNTRGTISLERQLHARARLYTHTHTRARAKDVVCRSVPSVFRRHASSSNLPGDKDIVVPSLRAVCNERERAIN